MTLAGTTPEAPAQAPRTRPMKILIAEDDGVSRLIIKKAVERRGHACELAENGDQAWELFERSPDIEVIISDWMMPGLTGPELCERVRAAEDEADATYTYFIILTGLEGTRNALDGMRAGADDYLTKPLDQHELEMRLIAASRVTALYEELASAREMLHQQARTDPLTGKGNRLLMREHLEQLDALAERYGHTYSLALFDIDKFKLYNDTCGHQAGDTVLREVAEALDGAGRKEDAVFRFGGEELLVVLPEQDEPSAGRAAERMRAAVEALAIPHPGKDPAGLVTVSGGVAAMPPGTPPPGADALLKAADAALYRAKEGGRNRVEVAAEPVATA